MLHMTHTLYTHKLHKKKTHTEADMKGSDDLLILTRIRVVT